MILFDVWLLKDPDPDPLNVPDPLDPDPQHWKCLTLNYQ